MPEVKRGKGDTEMLKCPKCKLPAFMEEGNKKFCPGCNFYFEHSSMKKEIKRKIKIEKKSKKRGRLLFLAAVIISIIVISVSAYYYWYTGTESEYISIYEVSEIRGLQAKKDVPPQTMTKDELVDYLDKLMTEEEKARMEKQETIYRNTFIIEDDIDFVNLSIESSADQIAGFYDPETKEMYVIGNHLSSYVNSVLSHEYTHALQDQYFDLGVFIENLSYDKHLARLSVVEGDATLVMNQYIMNMSKEELLLMSLDTIMTMGSSIIGSPSGEGNKAITSLTLFPYMSGATFVQKIYDNGKWNGVNQLYESPPTSSEQIIHYDKYISGEDPVEINFELPISGFDLEFNETLGEYFISQMLDLHIGTSVDTSLMTMMGIDMTSSGSKKAAAGWGGDTFNYYTRDNDFLSVFRTTWDTAKDNDEFNEAYDELIFTIEDYHEDEIFSIRDSYLYKDSSGLNTTIYYSNDIDIIRELLE